MDNSADPCTDFYQYSCGGLINSINLPAGVGIYIPVFSNVQYNNYVILNDIVTDQWPLIGDLYESCMAGNKHLDVDTSATVNVLIAEVRTLPNTSVAAVFPLLGQLHRAGVDAFFIPTQQNNIFQAGSLVSLFLVESGITYSPYVYTSPSNRYVIANRIFVNVSAFTTFSMERATNVVNLEAALANIYVEPETYEELFVNMTWSSFISLTGLDYNLYTQSFGLTVNDLDTVIVAVPSFFGDLTQILAQTNRQTVVDYLMWRTINSLVFGEFPVYPEPSIDDTETVPLQLLTNKFQQGGVRSKAHSLVDFGILKDHLTAATSFTSQQINCIDTVDGLLGDFLGLIFTMEVLDLDVINAIRTVTGGVQNSFQNNLADLTWIDTPSKVQAAYKLSNILQIIGHPNKLDRYRGLQLDPNHFLSNIIAIQERVFDGQMSTIGTPFDRSDNEFPATIVNAFYSPMTNTINFPAGILESPMFSASFPAILQYARMGYVIGHEMTHGFDNNGRLWNAHGLYQPIMDDSSSEKFNVRAQCIVDQYDQFQPVPGYFVDGEQTLGENIADLSGVKNAYGAYKAWTLANGTADMQLDTKSPIVSHLTNKQLFFVMMAQTWCTKATDAAIIYQLLVDVHSPSKYRVNGPLANLPAFSDAFSCSKNSPMNPSNKCELW